MIPMQGGQLRHWSNMHRPPVAMVNGQPRNGARFASNGANNLPHLRSPNIRQSQTQAQNQSQFSPNDNNNMRFPRELQNLMKSDKNKPWGWTTMDGVIVPYIMRGNERYVSVKMVESKLLSKFPKINMEDMNNVGPIYSYYITDNEAKLLTEINTRCYNHGFGAKSFTTKDLIVSLENFTTFYNRAKKHFNSKGTDETTPPASSASSVNTANSRVPYQGRIDGGWVQINNTVVPYLLRLGVKFVPLSVIKYAAGLLTDIRMDGHKVPCSEQEYHFLNTCCRSAHINFTFSIKTKLIKLEHVIRMSQSKVNIIELPPNEPFTHAQYQFGRQSPGEGGAMPHMGYQLPLMQPQMAPQAQPQMAQQAHSQVVLQTHSQMSPQGQRSQMSPPNMLPMQQHMPPRNPFLPHTIRPGMAGPAAMQHGPHPHAPFRSRGPVPFTRGPSPVANAMARDMRTPSPSISPRTQATMSMPIRVPRPQANSNSSTPSSRPSSTQSRNSVTPPSVQNQPNTAPKQNENTITVYTFEGKNVSCLMRGEGKEPYALLEALVKLYFPQCSLPDFQSALEQVLNIPVQQLTTDEEVAFIRFYELQVKALRSKAIVSFMSFKDAYAQLQYIFKTSDSSSPSETSQDGVEDNIKEDNSIKDVINNNTNQDTNMPAHSDHVTMGTNVNKADTLAVNTQALSGVILNRSSELALTRKRSRAPSTSRKSKQVCKRLEDTVAMLRMRQGPSSTDQTDDVTTPDLVVEAIQEGFAKLTDTKQGESEIKMNIEMAPKTKIFSDAQIAPDTEIAPSIASDVAHRDEDGDILNDAITMATDADNMNESELVIINIPQQTSAVSDYSNSILNNKESAEQIAAPDTAMDESITVKPEKTETIEATAEPMKEQHNEPMTSNNKESEEQVSAQHDEPITVQNEEPVAVQNEESIAVQNEEPSAVQHEEPVTMQIEEQIVMRNEEPPAMQNKESAMRGDGQVESLNQKETQGQSETSLTAQSTEQSTGELEQPVTNQNEQSITTLCTEHIIEPNEESIMVQGKELVANQVEEPVTGQSEKPVTKQGDAPGTNDGDEPISEQNEDPPTQQSDEPMEEQSEEPVTEQSDKSITEQNEEPATEQCNEPIEEQSEGPVTKQSDAPIEEQREEPFTEQSDEPITERNEEPATEQCNEPIEEQSEGPVTKQSDEPLEERSEEPVTEPSGEPIAEQSVEPIREQNEELIAEQSRESVTEQSVDTITKQSEKSVTEQSNEPGAEESKEPVTEKRHNQITEQNEEPVTEKKDEQITEQRDGPIADQSEQSVAAQIVERIAEEADQKAITELIAEQSKEEVTAHGDQLHTTQKKSKVTAASEEPTTKDSENPNTEKCEKEDITESEEPVLEQRKKAVAVTTQCEKPIAEQSMEPIAEEDEEPASIINENLITAHNEELAIEQNEPITKENVEPITTQSESRMEATNEEPETLQEALASQTQTHIKAVTMETSDSSQNVRVEMSIDNGSAQTSQSTDAKMEKTAVTQQDTSQLSQEVSMEEEICNDSFETTTLMIINEPTQPNVPEQTVSNNDISESTLNSIITGEVIAKGQEKMVMDETSSTTNSPETKNP